MIVEKYSKLSPNRKYFRVTSGNMPFFTFIFWVPERYARRSTLSRECVGVRQKGGRTLSLPTGHNLTFSVLMIILSFFSAIHCVTTLCLKRLTFYASELGKISKMIETIKSTCDYDFQKSGTQLWKICRAPIQKWNHHHLVLKIVYNQKN